MSSLLKKYPSNAIKKAGEKYKISGDTSALLETLKKQNRVYETLSPETKQKLHHMKSNIIDNVGKSNIIDNLQMSEYVKELKNKRESLISDLHKRMLDNVLEIANHNNITDINEDDITIKNGKLYLCSVMFYGNLLDKEKRTKEYLSKPKKILEDGHIKAFDALIKITKKLFGDNALTYPYPDAKGSLAIGIFPGVIGENTSSRAKTFCNEFQEKNKDFFDEMTSIISGINLFDPEINSNDTKYMDICSIPLFVDSDENVFYYDQFNRRGVSGISTNPYEIRTNMYEYEFLS